FVGGLGRAVVGIFPPSDRERPEGGAGRGLVDPVHVIADLGFPTERDERPTPVLERRSVALVHFEANLRNATSALDLEDLRPARICPDELAQLAQKWHTRDKRMVLGRGHGETSLAAGRISTCGEDQAS